MACGIMDPLKRNSVRTTVDIPAPLYRKLRERAVAKDSSIRQLVVAAIRAILSPQEKPQPLARTEFPIIFSKGPKVDVSNEQIYEHAEFP